MKLHYRKYGQGEPLIILHGLFGSSDNWHSLARRWSETFQVFALDLRNHGSSPHESVMSYGEMAQDLKQFIEHQGFEHVNLLGHSMGGKVSMLYASMYPDMVSGLAILDIGIEKVKGKHTEILNTLTNLDPTEYDSRKEIQKALESHLSAPVLRQFLLKNILRRVDGSLAWKFNHEALLEHYADLTASLDLPDVFMGPTLFLRGESSDYLDSELDPLILQYFPLAQLMSINDAGHWLHADQPNHVYTLIKDFFT